MRQSYFIADYASQGRTLLVTGGWNADVESGLREFGVDSVALNYAHGYNERNLEFLHAGLSIRKLSILSRTTEDVTPVYRLASTLERLNVEASTRVTFDVSLLPLLTHLATDWSAVKGSAKRLRALEYLSIFGYSEDDLRALGEHRTLKSLRLKQGPRVVSLAGLELFPDLISLTVQGARRLRTIEHLAELHPGVLEHLSLESCRSIESFDNLSLCAGLETLNIGNIGPIDSLAPLAGLTMLRKVLAYESTNVLDGNLSLLLKMPGLREARLMNRKHYSPTAEQIAEQLKSR